MRSQTEITAWDLFVLRHQKPGNLIIHAISFFMFYGGPLGALFFHDWKWLGFFFLSGPLGAFGHYLFKDGGVDLHEMTSSPSTVGYVTLMFYRILRGKYQGDIETALSKKRPQQPQITHEIHNKAYGEQKSQEFKGH